MQFPSWGDTAFAVDAHTLLGYSHNAEFSDPEVAEVIDGFAHDLAAIAALPVAKDAPTEEQIQQKNMLAELFGFQAAAVAAAPDPAEDDA